MTTTYPSAVADALRPDAESLVSKIQSIVDKGGDPEVRPEVLADVTEQANKVAAMVGIEGVKPLTVGRRLDLLAKSGWQFMADGCHKIYVCRDQDDIDSMKDSGWDDNDLRPIAEIHDVWAATCFLRFVNMGNLQPHPWAIEQGEEEGEEE